MNTSKLTVSLLSFSLLGALPLLAEEVTTKETVTKTEVTEKKGLSAATGEEVGIASQDGIRLSGAVVLVTRNGVTEKLIKPVELQNGTKVMPDGTMMLKSGDKVPMRGGQLLTFDGKLMESDSRAAGSREAVQPKSIVTGATVVQPTTIVTKTAVETKEGTKAVSEDAAEKAAKEIDRRENEAK